MTNTDGRTIEAEVLSVEEGQVTIRRIPGNQEMRFALNLLIPADREYLRSLEKTESESTPKKTKIEAWPRKVKPESYDVMIVKEDNQKNEYIYQTPHFEFHSNVKLARKVVREFSQIFESTYVAVGSLPVLWKPKAPEEGGRFVTRIYETVEQYEAAGAVPNSGGTYFHGSREIKVPLRYLGVKKSSSGYTLDDRRSADVLAHEITHQLTHNWLSILPMWLTEGIAEYIEYVPRERGAYRFDRMEVSESLRSEQVAMLPLQRIMKISRKEWNSQFNDDSGEVSRNYRSAYLLQYFFNHLDGEGKGQRMFDYLRALESGESNEAAEGILLAKRSYAELEDELKSAFRREGVKINFIR